jgi:hypothetical protein
VRTEAPPQTTPSRAAADDILLRGWRPAPSHHRVKAMTAIGQRIEETGTLLREAGGFALRRDLGGRWKLDLHRVPVDHIEKRVRITGVVVAEGLVDVDGVAPEAAIMPASRTE